LRFLQSHLNAIEKKWITLNYNYNSVDSINKIYHDIIDLNFKEDEIYHIIKLFFKNNLTWYNFEKFRNIILLGSDNYLEKLYFVSFQYHDIQNSKKYIIYDINKYIDNMLDDYIDNIFNIKITQKYIKTKNSEYDFDIGIFGEDISDYRNNNNNYNNYNTIELTSINVDHNLIIEFLKNYHSKILYTQVLISNHFD
jgi:hypothetical protein